jgi:hypothetical protein
MANPNLGTTALPVYFAVLGEAQLGTGNTDLTVPTGKAWKPTSGTLCNVSVNSVTVTVSVLAASGGTARRVLSTLDVLPGDSVDISPYLPAQLPEGAIIRATASAATSIDLLIAGTVLGA